MVRDDHDAGMSEDIREEILSEIKFNYRLEWKKMLIS